ncbi:hypothetical protein [Hwanghaeella sp.]|uniref:hypothetical protein n=1 Tax=Hwanghaeella sp. TaxID=2605943 RepID=UPI003CCBAEEC
MTTIATFGALSHGANAADFTSTGRLSIQGSYETNPELRRSNKTHVAERQLSPGWVGEWDGETYGLDFDLGATFVRTSDETITPDSLRYDTTVAGDVDLDRVRLSGSLDYSLSAFDNTEFNDNELTTDADSASVSNDVQVDDVSLTTRFEYDWSDRMSLFLEDSFRAVSFSGGNSTDFTNTTVATGVSYDWSDVITITPRVEYRKFEPADTEPTNVIETSMGINHQLNDTSTYNLTVGMLRTGSERKVTFDASYEKTFEEYVLRLTGNRDVTPSDDGELRESRSLGFDIAHALSATTRAGIDGLWRENDDLEARRLGFNMSHDVSPDVVLGFTVNVVQSISENLAGTTKEMQYRADPFLNWTFAENLNARFSYRELWEDTDNQGSVNTRRATVAVTYTHPFN